MRMPEAKAVVVVEHDGEKMFSMPEGVGYANDPRLCRRFFVMHFGSYAPSSPGSGHDIEVDTHCVIFRQGKFLTHGRLDYIFGQDSGYHVVGSFGPIDAGHGVTLEIDGFEVGDVIIFLVMQHKSQINT